MNGILSKEFFDGSRDTGYGGFGYNARFWQPVIPTFQQHFNLSAGSKILDVGCAKGFMLHDFKQLIPGISISGIDVSEYAIEHAVDDVRPFVKVANAIELPFEDNSFDAVISITTLHNLEKEELAIALKEVERVSKGKSFITVDAYRNNEEKERAMEKNSVLCQVENLHTYPAIKERLENKSIKLHSWYIHLEGAKIEYYDQDKKGFRDIINYEDFSSN